uniref:Uncharacterized protein n=1 Tax=Oryza punctata TaxID=4537 RepID=A0A0E0KZT4_ORYPU
MNTRASDSNALQININQNKNIIVERYSSVTGGLLPAALYCCRGEGRATATGAPPSVPPLGGSERKREGRVALSSTPASPLRPPQGWGI